MSNFARHNATQKHTYKLNALEKIPKNENEYSNIKNIASLNENTKRAKKYTKCPYCNRISEKKNLNRHFQSCKEKLKEERDEKIDKLTNELKTKDIILKEKMDELKDIESEYMEFMKEVARSATNGGLAHNITNNNTINMYFVVQRYLDAKNYEELMKAPLTITEKDYVMKHGGMEGCYHILDDRCIKHLKLEERPFHCVDESRSKYMLRTGNEWKIDKKAEQIMDAIYPKILQLCIPKTISCYEELAEWKVQSTRMSEIAAGKNKIIKRLNKRTLLKNNVKKLQ